MKKTGFAVAVLFLLAVSLTPVASACMLRIFIGEDADRSAAAEETEVVHEAAVGAQEVLVVRFLMSHRNCDIPLKATEIKTKGLRILEQSEWETVRRGIYEKTFRVEYTEIGPAVFIAERKCPRGGMRNELKINVK